MNEITAVEIDGVIRKKWDDTTGTYTEYDADGTQTLARPYTAEEQSDATERATASTQAANEATLLQKASAAVQGNRDFLALTAPTNAQVVAQVKALTRQNNALIRLIVRDFTGTD
jgi:transcriptional accessory protein Tex/SPT6